MYHVNSVGICTAQTLVDPSGPTYQEWAHRLATAWSRVVAILPLVAVP